MPDKKRQKPQNTDSQETQYINFNQNFPDNQNNGDTIVFKPLKKVDNSNSNNQNYQRRNDYNYNNQNAYQRHNNNTPPPEPNDYAMYQRRNINEYNNPPQYNNNNPPQNFNQYNNNQNVYRSPAPQSSRPAPRPADETRNNPKPRKKKRKKRSAGCLGRIIRSLIIIFLILFIIYSLISLIFIKQIKYVESAPITHYSNALSDSKVKNILLIGTDTRDSSEERGRSDSMILLSLNSRTDKMYLTSIMRDSYVDIDGYGWDKLTHAYSYGGAELLMDTIEKNFSIRIDDYIAINFNAFAAIVDAVDGIEIEISDAEAEEINTILQAEVNELMGDDINSDLLEKGGKLILNGKQALSYSRIRYVGNSDFERTQRQRDVMEKIIGKLKSFNPSSIGGILKSALPQLSTNMTTGELYVLSLRLPFLFSYELEQQRIPAEDTYYNTYTDDGGDALGIDFDSNLEIIKDTIFGE